MSRTENTFSAFLTVLSVRFYCSQHRYNSSQAGKIWKDVFSLPAKFVGHAKIANGGSESKLDFLLPDQQPVFLLP